MFLEVVSQVDDTIEWYATNDEKHHTHEQLLIVSRDG